MNVIISENIFSSFHFPNELYMLFFSSKPMQNVKAM